MLGTFQPKHPAIQPGSLAVPPGPWVVATLLALVTPWAAVVLPAFHPSSNQHPQASFCDEPCLPFHANCLCVETGSAFRSVFANLQFPASESICSQSADTHVCSVRSCPFSERSMNIYQEASCNSRRIYTCVDPDSLVFSRWEL